MAVSLRTPLILDTDDDLVRVSRENPGYQFEREEDGTVVVSPTHTKGGAKSGEALGQLWHYAKRAGGKAFDSQTGFAVGPGARVYCPDAAWVSQARIDAIAPSDAKGFWAISPDVAIEVKSDTDAFGDVLKKIGVYLQRGSVYAVAIDPTTRKVEEVGEAPDGLALDFDAIIDA